MALNISNKTSKFYIVAMSAFPELLILFHAVCDNTVTTINLRFLVEKNSSVTILRPKPKYAFPVALIFLHYSKSYVKKVSYSEGPLSINNSMNRY